MQTIKPSNFQQKCKSCNTDLLGDYCHLCGEKIVHENDFSIIKIIEQGIDIFTHIDSKIYKSAIALLFKPGHLSVLYVQGVRKSYMKPIQLFLLANVLFFLLLSSTDVFRKPSAWWFESSNDMNVNIADLVLQKSNESNKSIREIALLYDQKSNTYAKTFVFSFIPILGFVLSILFVFKKLQFGKHIIFAIHFFSFVLVVMVIWAELVDNLFHVTSNLYYVIPIQIILFVYIILGLKKFYKTTWWYTIISSILLLLCFNYSLEIYRFLVSYLTLLSIH